MKQEFAPTPPSRRLTPVAPWPSAGTVEEYIRAETVRAVFQQASLGPLLSLLAAGLMTLGLWRAVPHGRLLVWCGGVTLTSLARQALVTAYRRRPPATDQMIWWEHAFLYTLVGVSLAWGGGALLITPNSVTYEALVYFFLIGIAGSAVASYSAYPTACMVAVTCLVLPVTVRFAWDDVTELRVMAAGGAVYLIAAIRAMRTYGSIWRHTFQLSWELRRAHSLADKLARTDELTGLYNRRAFTELGHQALEYARRYSRPLGLVMFDIDRFKAINDTYGHAAGDRVLQAVGATILGAARSFDIAGRLGGEEFAILMPETDGAEAVAFAERLRRDLFVVAVEHQGATIRVSCSFGVATGGGDVILDTLLNRADAAMYRAKREGRNRISSASRTITQPGA